MNKHVLDGEKLEIPLLKIDHTVEEEQHRRLEELRRKRDNAKVKRALADLKAACTGKENVMYPILEAVRSYATLGEICGTMKEIFGSYEEPPMY